MNPPKHVAIIMDGNGRWGIKKKKNRNYGHKKGIETVEEKLSEKNVQNITDKHISIVDDKVSSKEKEIMTI